MIRKLLVCLSFLCLSSCVPKKDVVYFQDVTKLSQEPKYFETVIAPDDLLMITVMAQDPEAALPFNMPVVPVATNLITNVDLATGPIRYQTYLVDKEGYIIFPVLGKVKVGGLKKSEIYDFLQKEVSKYIKEPTLNIRITNYKVSVMGEVLRPGSFSFVSERVTLPEALSMAGDLTIYGDRKNITVIREQNGVRTYNIVDITSVDFLSSEFYYLSQNDLVYVSPNKTKVNSSAVGPNTTVIISSLSLLITVVALIVR